MDETKNNRGNKSLLTKLCKFLLFVYILQFVTASFFLLIPLKRHSLQHDVELRAYRRLPLLDYFPGFGWICFFLDGPWDVVIERNNIEECKMFDMSIDFDLEKFRAEIEGGKIIVYSDDDAAVAVFEK